MAINKVDINGKNMLDLTGIDLTPDKVDANYSFVDKSGEFVQGTALTYPMFNGEKPNVIFEEGSRFSGIIASVSKTILHGKRIGLNTALTDYECLNFDDSNLTALYLYEKASFETQLIFSHTTIGTLCFFQPESVLQDFLLTMFTTGELFENTTINEIYVRADVTDETKEQLKTALNESGLETVPEIQSMDF